MTFHAFPVKIGSPKFSIDFSDLRLAITNNNENDAISLVISNIDLNIYDRVVVLNSSTYVMNEFNI